MGHSIHVWTGEEVRYTRRELTPSELALHEAGLLVFHGKHNQKSHAGGRSGQTGDYSAAELSEAAAARSGEDVLEDSFGHGRSFREFGAKLRAGDIDADVASRVDAIDGQFATHGTASTQTVTVYRSMRDLDPELVSSFQPGSSFTDDAYMFTSADRATALRYGNPGAGPQQNVLLEIRVPPGTPVVSPHGSPEIVLPRGQSFRVVDARSGEGDERFGPLQVTLEASGGS